MPRHAAVPSLTIACHHERTFTCEPTRTALLVIDMQREFFATSEDDLNPMLEIVPRVARLVTVARKAGMRVIHTREGYAPDLSDVSAYRATLDYVG